MKVPTHAPTPGLSSLGTLVLRYMFFSTTALLLSFAACDRSQPVEPAIQAAPGGSAGPTVKAPSNVEAAAASHSRIDVSWQDNSGNETGFEVDRSTTGPNGTFALLASTAAGATGYSDVGLAGSTQYCYAVRAFRTTPHGPSYSELSTPTCATTLAPPLPGAPTATNATPASSQAADVSWIDQSTTEAGFRVERSADLGSTWTSVGTTGPNVTSFQEAGLGSEQRVCYHVIAFNVSGDSPPSNMDCTTPPAGPSGLTATAVDGSAIDLAWTDNSAVEDGYEVLRATDGVTFSTVANLPANSANHRDVAVNSTISYSYRVQAKKDDGFSDLSNTVTVAGSCVPTTVEVCDNGLDDECDGLIDTEDDDCQCFAHECPQGFLCDGWSGFCFSHCGDGVWNGDEGDVDCGGSCQTRCAAGQHCWDNGDCASFSCVNDICQ